MRSSQSLYSAWYSDRDGVSSLITDPIERSSDRIGRSSWSFLAGSRKRLEKSSSRIAATESMSASKSATYWDPKMNASVMSLEISDLPPPETVAGLWHDVGLGTVPIRLHAVRSSACWASSTR